MNACISSTERVCAGLGIRRLGRMWVPSSILYCVVLFPLTGCGSSNPQPVTGTTFSQSDSAGISLAITTISGELDALGWLVSSEPTLVIGATGSDFLHRVQGVQGTKDDGVLVVDGGSQELRFYNAEGLLTRRAGGPGEGPGEFRDPVLVPVMGRDSLLVFDKRLLWAQVLSPEGDFGRMIHHTNGRPYGGRAPVGAVDYAYFLFNSSGTSGGAETPPPERGLVQARQSFMWYDTVTASRHTVDSVEIDFSFYDLPMSWMVPFTSRSAAVTSESGALIARGENAEILDYDVQGRLRKVIRIEKARRPVTREMIDAHIDIEVSKQPDIYSSLSRSAWHRAYEAMGIPDSLPAFQALQIDELGWLWAEVYEFDPKRSREWVVFDAEGRARGTVQIPPGLQVQWIGRDAILGIWRDEFGVEYVHRYRLTRDANLEDDSQPR